eukprot:TRINITY_DN4172_c0_g1_i5.p1 TRINITY_DN4172_c0_g1~~TRINITY_DN4172_c0_g1_i5.p1  ORF type:complete len:809 (-),score=3.29 TRINITY_DN4172_c0_g1_i5:188-2614(-)
MTLAFPTLTATVAPPPSTLWSPNLTAPFPTNAPWQNFVLGDGGMPEVVPPYVVRSSQGGVAASYPSQTVATAFIIQSFVASFVLSALEGLSTHQVTAYDDVSVTLAYSTTTTVAAAAATRPVLLVPLVRGSPYLTFLFRDAGATPVLSADQGIASVEATAGGTKHRVTLANGQTWLIYSSAPVAFTQDNATLTAAARFTGTLRAALLPGNAAAAEEAILDAHAMAVVVGGAVEVSAFRLKYRWAVAPWGEQTTAAAVAPLMLTLPMHRRMSLRVYDSTPTAAGVPFPASPPAAPPSAAAPSAAPPSSAFPSLPADPCASAPSPLSAEAMAAGGVWAAISSVDPARRVSAAAPPPAAAATAGPVPPAQTLVYRTLDGLAVGAAGGSWEVKAPAVHTAWHTRWLSTDPDLTAALRTAVRNDSAALAPILDTSTYTFGKVAARAARLALIAEQLGEAEAQDRAVGVVRDALSAWFNGSVAGNALLYDPSWGGVVSANGAADSGADFGMGCYNDHHFHFGYWLYAAAVVARNDQAWAVAHRHHLLNLVSDIMSPRATSAFPKLRHFDLYSLHSWASGLFEFADGRNQESFSEGVNAYYSASLLGLAFGDLHMANLAATLASVESLAAQTLIQVDMRRWDPILSTDVSAAVAGAPAAGSASAPSSAAAAPKSASVPLSSAALAAAATSGFPNYDETFANANRLVGMVWANKRDAGLWFAAADQIDKRVGIQVLPITPYLLFLFPDREFNAKVTEWALPLVQTDGVTDQWKAFTWAVQATHDPQAARKNIEALSVYDEGNSQSNMLWWLAVNSP